MTKISVLGSGSWGCGLSYTLSKNNHDVLIWGRNHKQVAYINKGKSLFLPNVVLSKNIKATTELDKVANFSDIILIALPSHAIFETLENLNKYIDVPKSFINASKGLEPHSLMRISEVVYESINIENIKSYVLLTGPSHAEEVVKENLTTVVAISYDEDAAKVTQNLFSTDFFRVYTNDDLIGGELCGAMKNAMAIGAGILDGLGFGDNSKAAFIVRSINEMMHLGNKMGIKQSTFFGLAGMGDAIVTCISKHSRNRNTGELLGKGYSLDDAIKSCNMVVEGIPSIKSIYRLSKQYNTSMPIITELYNIVYSKKDVKTSINDLMTRNLTSE